MDEDRERWDERYRDAVDPEPAPPDGLEAWMSLLPQSGRALDLACGLGAQTVWAAGRGFDVDAVDASPVAIEVVRRLADRQGDADRVHARVVDFDQVLASAFDGAVDSALDDIRGNSARDRYDLVICQRFRDPRLYPLVAELLAPSGVAVVTVLSAVGLSAPPGPHHAPPGELATAFESIPGIEILEAVEAAGQATVVLRRAP